MIQPLLLVLALSSDPAGNASNAPLALRAPRNLRLEYLVEPLGIDERKPRFSWELDDERRGVQQSAYRLLVASSPEELAGDKGSLWDSGKVPSRDTCQVLYAGAELQSWHSYFWKVQWFDGEGQASPWSAVARWGEGPLYPADWKGKWIVDPKPATEFSPGNRGWSSEFCAKEDDYKWVKFDLGEGATWNTVRLYPARSDDARHGSNFLFPIRLNVFGSDTPEFDSATKAFRVIDQNEFDIERTGDGMLELRAQNKTLKMRYCLVGFTKLGRDPQRGYGAAFAEVQILDGTRDVSTGRPAWSSDSREGDGWGLAHLNDGVTTSEPAQGDDALPQPILRREFESGAGLARATLTCSALGLYEARINGKRVGNDVLAPGWNDYRKRNTYQTYDVTALLGSASATQPARNAIAVQLADGWYAGRIGLTQHFAGGPTRGIYGRKPAFFGQLDLWYADGRRETIPSDESWKSTLEGPLVAADLLDGERWDARRELAGFDQPGYDDSRWSQVDVAELRCSLNSQRGTSVRVIGTEPPASVTRLGPNRWLYDFGRNRAGWCRVRARAPAGAELVLRHAETKQDDGTLYTANLRSAQQTDHYVFKGGALESFAPQFTFHGFRYVEASVTGLPAGTEIEQPDLVAEIVSNSAESTGSFHAQQPTLTKIWENVVTTLQANIQSLPTDCPQRDERLGWMGDIQVFAPTAMYQADLAPFLSQWMQSVRDAYGPGYRFSDFAPDPFQAAGFGPSDFVGAPGWADAAIFIPWQMLQVYGDRRVAEISLSFASRWLDTLASQNPDGLWKAQRGNDYGDWLNGSQIQAPGWKTEGCEVPKEVFATAFFARSAEMVGEICAALGKNEPAERYLGLHDKIRDAFVKAYVKPDGTIEGDTQAGYVLALAFDLVPANLVPLVQAKLSVAITEARGWHMTTGMQTTGRMLLELSHRGYEEVASRLARSKEFPSWGWQIEQGATSIWERWDGWMPGRGYQDPGMNSFNHYAFGSIGEWLMSCVAGIDRDPDSLGFERFRIDPRAGEQIPAAGGRYHSIRGWIESDWKIQGDTFVLDCTIPPNTSATVVLPALGIESVREGGKSIHDAAPFVLPTGFAKNRVSLDVRAGTYHFESQFKLGGK